MIFTNTQNMASELSAAALHRDKQLGLSPFEAAFEELGELAVALSHYKRQRCGKEAVLDEVADVYLNLVKIQVTVGISDTDLNFRIAAKVERTLQAIRRQLEEEPPQPEWGVELVKTIQRAELAEEERDRWAARVKLLEAKLDTIRAEAG